MAPPFCWTCQGLCVIEARPLPPDRRASRDAVLLLARVRWLDESNPGRYTGDRNYLDRYHGWEASEVIRDLGFVRADGETLIGQPHLTTSDAGRWLTSAPTT